jgi:choline kinase
MDESEGTGKTGHGHAKEGKEKERKHHLHGLHRGEHGLHGFHRGEHGHHQSEHGQKGDDSHRDKLLSDVVGWLQSEKAKRAAKKSRRRGADGSSANSAREDVAGASSSFRPRTSSMDSDSSNISLERLQRILEDNMSAFGLDSLPLASPMSRRPSVLGRRKGSMKRVYSSDTEYQEGDVVVPSCDVVLDNSKTMSYSGGGATTESSASTVTLSTSKRAEKERKHWLQFKSEIVRLAHTLRLKGWRKVPLERGGEIEVERLSGALTNAVYVVSPPPGLSQPQSSGNGSKAQSTKPPPKLLLRIYGPQVEHLIDRENELEILKRLSRKRIGPRMLGTFRNGRFEEYFNATTLKFEDLRVKDTSKQIAKRMRELHEGIDLLDREIEEGPFVWRNWDKWVDRCEEVITYLDGEILSKRNGKEAWRERGLICGVEWKVFKGAVDKYRKWLDEYYKKKGGVESRLVFAHNDVSPVPLANAV